MTALKPLEQLEVHGVASVRYPINKTCAHPECDKPTESVHHAFPRSQTGNGSWFVVVGPKKSEITDKAIPHAVGLCGHGTAGHHGDLEDHRAWLRLEDGVWNWYERAKKQHTHPRPPEWEEDWVLTGPINPQPGSVTGGPKKRKRKQGEARRARRTISIAVPQDEQEQGAGILDDLVQAGREEWAEQLGWSETVPAYFVIVAAFAKALQA